jgi:hypothetical protein
MTHQHRRVMNRRVTGTPSSAAINTARVIAAQVRVMSRASRHRAAARMVRVVSSVRHRQAVPAALRWTLAKYSSRT